MSKFVINTIKSILSTRGLAGEFLLHYFQGKGAQKSLPKWAVEETKEAIKDSFQAHIKSAMDYKSCVARCGGLEGYEWWEGLAGVIGEFRWAPEFVEGGVIFHCWDKFDFNPVFNELPIPIPNKDIANKIISMAKMGYVSEEDIAHDAIYWTPLNGGTLWICELYIKKWEGKVGVPFLTKWKLFIPNEELEPYTLESLEVGKEGAHLRTKGKPFIKDYILKAEAKGVKLCYSFKQRRWQLPDGSSHPYYRLIK